MCRDIDFSPAFPVCTMCSMIYVSMCEYLYVCIYDRLSSYVYVFVMCMYFFVFLKVFLKDYVIGGE